MAKGITIDEEVAAARTRLGFGPDPNLDPRKHRYITTYGCSVHGGGCGSSAACRCRTYWSRPGDLSAKASREDTHDETCPTCAEGSF